MHHNHDTRKIEEGRDDGGNDDIGIRNPGHFRHQKGCGAHDRGHDLSTGRGGSFYCCGKFGTIAHLFHHRNSEAAGAYSIGYRAAGDGPLQGTGDNGYFSRSPGSFPCQAVGNVDKKLTDTGALQERAEENKQKDKGGADSQRRADDTFCREIQMGGDALQTEPTMAEIARHIVAKVGVGDETAHND